MDISLEQLRGMISVCVWHAGERYVVIEVLEDGPSLVLERERGSTIIQANQYGDASRRVRPTLTIPVLSPDKKQLHSSFLGLELIDS
jgi:hypothetical protein